MEGRLGGWAGSPYERRTDERYFPSERLRGGTGNRWKFMLDLLVKSWRCDTLVIGHINLAPAALLLKMRYPRLRLVVIAHGIEVWAPLSGWKLRALRRADQVVAVSEFTRQKLVEVQKLPADRIAVLPNPLDPFFQPPRSFDRPAHLLGRYGLRPGQKVLLTVSRLNPGEGYKGYDRVMVAMTSLLRDYPGLTYLLVGRSHPDEQARLERLVDELNLHNHVRFTGFVPDEELPDHYRLADAFVLPSKKEGFGLVFIEAMACGAPAIGGDRDGSAEALGHGELGHLTDPDDVAAIARAIRHVLETPHDPARIQRRALDRFGFEVYKRNLAGLLTGHRPGQDTPFAATSLPKTGHPIVNLH
jgi:glycosyltransferase involved in cell wall biosynthesis